MNHVVSLLVAVFLLISSNLSLSFADTTDDSARERLPELTLITPDNEAHREYLGLKGEPGSPFTLSDIDADVLLIELFSMYCPFCQEEAPNVNSLYWAMGDISNPDFRVKIIGLGANNTEFEVDHFRSTYNVPFPLFADKDLSQYNSLGGKGTPGFIGSKKNEDGSYTIVLRQSGGFYSVEEFLSELLRNSGYNSSKVD